MSQDVEEIDNKFIEVAGTSEDEQDFGSIASTEIASVAIATTDWTTETILSQLVKGNIDLNPSFQRRDAWEIKRKSQFIESLILGLPVPQIVLAEKIEHKGTYIVLDGKQRLLSLRQFTSDVSDPDFRPFKLANLVVRTDLNNKTYKDLKEDLHFRTDVTSLENAGIRAVVLRNCKSEKLLGHIFLRLNMGSKSLSPQELRQALHPGPFLKFADDSASANKTISEILGKNTPDFRMRDVELIIRYFSFRYNLASYHGNLKEFFDESCKNFNDKWVDISRIFEDDIKQLDLAHDLIKEAFGENYNYGKWLSHNLRFETRFNRAVFDILIIFAADKSRHDIVIKNPALMVKAFKVLCESDSRFLESIERTTKSIESTKYRITKWFLQMSTEYKHNFEPPQIAV